MQNTFLKPRIINVESLGAGRSVVEMEPFERGYGHTLGNALRRVLLSSMVGYAPTEVNHCGVVHDIHPGGVRRRCCPSPEPEGGCIQVAQS